MNQQTVSIQTPHGLMPVEIFRPEGAAGPWPATIMYMDGIGPRPALSEMARRLSDQGYMVLLPNLYYRSGPWKPLVPTEAFQEGPARQQMLSAMGALTIALVASDSDAMLNWLKTRKEVKVGRVGLVGYCMGCAHAVTAAANHPDQVPAVAAFHGARLVTDQPDSPHLRLQETKAGMYFGVAGIDPWLAPDETDRLRSALDDAKCDYKLEVYPEVKHGFAVIDTPAFDAAAGAKHWSELTSLFAAKLK